jgi:hypothetical protein
MVKATNLKLHFHILQVLIPALDLLLQGGLLFLQLKLAAAALLLFFADHLHVTTTVSR